MALSTNFSTDPVMRTMRRMERDLDRLFGDFYSGDRASVGTELGKWAPPVDMYEKDGNVIVHAELPGIPREKVNVEINDNVLTISGESKQEKEYTKGQTHYQERSYGSFHRQLSLPEGTKGDNATAKFENGVLTIVAPKSETSTKKKITVQ